MSIRPDQKGEDIRRHSCEHRMHIGDDELETAGRTSSPKLHVPNNLPNSLHVPKIFNAVHVSHMDNERGMRGLQNPGIRRSCER